MKSHPQTTEQRESGTKESPFKHALAHYMKEKNYSIDIQKYLAKNLKKDEVRLYNYAYSDYSKAKKAINANDQRVLLNKNKLGLLYDNDDYPLSATVYNNDEIKTDMQKHMKIRYRQSMKPTTGRVPVDLQYTKVSRFSLVPFQ